ALPDGRGVVGEPARLLRGRCHDRRDRQQHHRSEGTRQRRPRTGGPARAGVLAAGRQSDPADVQRGSRMTPALDVVALGEPLYELNAVPGRPRQYLQGFGGDTSNASIAAARQGAKVAYFTRLGDDEFGKQFLELWRSEGVDASAV